MHRKTLPRTCVPAVLAALAVAAPASASTIGATGYSDSFCDRNAIQAQDSYAVALSGTITSFSTQETPHFTGRTPDSELDQMDFLVLRPTSTGSWTVVGKSGVKTLGASGGVRTFPVTPIEVQAGDILGWFNVTGHAACVRYPASGPIRGVTGVSDPAVGADVPLSAPFSGVDLNLSANFVPHTAAGAGNTNPASASPPNAFTLSTADGTLTYQAGGKTFNGTITCTNFVGTAATIVAVDHATGLVDRTMVQDNGATGDKLVNTMFDPSKLSARSVAKFSTCVDPDVAALAAHAALDGDAIQIT